MSSIVDKFDEPIIAIVCQDYKDDIYITHLMDPIRLGDMDFQDDLLMAENLIIHYEWFSTVIACTEETLAEIKEEYKKA